MALLPLGRFEQPCRARFAQMGLVRYFACAKTKGDGKLYIESSTLYSVLRVESSNPFDEANVPIAKFVQCVCHGTLPWLISVSLDGMREIDCARVQQRVIRGFSACSARHDCDT